jgi:hypothetical protein
VSEHWGDDLLRDLPIEIWTESDIGQALLQLAREGRCKYTRLNSTFGRFETIDRSREEIMQELADQAQDLDLGYSPMASTVWQGNHRPAGSVQTNGHQGGEA